MSLTRPAAVIVLAAGEGTRMKSATPKVLHTLCGRSMLGHVVAAAQALEPEKLIVVVGHGKDQVERHLEAIDPTIVRVHQEVQNGTGHAVRMVVEYLDRQGQQLEGTVVVGYGDTPLLTAETLRALVEAHAQSGSAVTVLSAVVPDPTGYGRILRDESGAVVGIVEQKDASAEQRAITEINSGVYAFDGKLLQEAIHRLRTDNAQGEEYLTDVVGILRGDGYGVGAHLVPDHREILGVNDRVQLAEARRIFNERLLTRWMRAGVTVVDPATTWIDVDVTLEPDVVIHPQTQLQGRTRVARGAEVGPNSTLTDTTVGEHATVTYAVCKEAEIGPEASVGPYAYLRPGTRLARKGKIGTYVETKNAEIGEGTKVPHLTYVGDATIGDHTNIGAATVFVNYDGVHKHHTTVGSHCRTGADNMFVAPVTIGDGAYTAAGSIITEDVPPGAMAVARARQRNIEGWVARKRAGTPAHQAAERALAANTLVAGRPAPGTSQKGEDAAAPKPTYSADSGDGSEETTQ